MARGVLDFEAMNPRPLALSTLSTICATTLLVLGCGGADDPPANPSTTAAPTTASLAYTQKCAKCHGPKGVSEVRVDKDAGLRPLIPPVIPGRLSLATYKVVVREGRPPEMPAYSAVEISDADLAADYEWMRAQP